jgi:hypothetical protein
MAWKLTLYKEDDEGNQKFYEPHQDFDYSNLSEGFSNDDLVEIKEEEHNETKINKLDM